MIASLFVHDDELKSSEMGYLDSVGTCRRGVDMTTTAVVVVG